MSQGLINNKIKKNKDNNKGYFHIKKHLEIYGTKNITENSIKNKNKENITQISQTLII